MAIQTILGKAFEYACLNSLDTHLRETQPVEIQQTAALNVAFAAYNTAANNMRQNMDLAADAAIRVLVRMEPQLKNPTRNNPLYLTIQEDSAGIVGDVRDVLTIRSQNNWEIGISCKHNHSAIKHSRLSSTIDFGQSWFDIPCSQTYFNTINPLFDELKIMRQNNARWNAVNNKAERFYMPLLNAFMAELIQLDQENPGIVPGLLLRYMIGSNDFYKIITHDRRRVTQIQAFSMYGTLNRSAGHIRPQIRLPQLTMPSTFFNIGYKPNSTNTIFINCNQGWGVSLRIHSASSMVEPSLKFDATLIGIPPGLYTHHEPW